MLHVPSFLHIQELTPTSLSYQPMFRCDEADLPNKDMSPVPRAKQVMTNVSRFQEQE